MTPILAGEGSPLFIVHWASGNIRFIQHSAKLFASGHPVYGFEAVGIRQHYQPSMSIDQMAERYLRQMREFQPRGPYMLAGICAGSIIAYEMASQLVAAGHEVGYLCLIDSFRPGKRWYPVGCTPGEIYSDKLAQFAELAQVPHIQADLPAVIRVLKECYCLDVDMPTADFYQNVAVYAATVYAQENHIPSHFDGEATLLFPGRRPGAADNLADIDWSGVAPKIRTLTFDVRNIFQMLSLPDCIQEIRTGICSVA